MKKRTILGMLLIWAGVAAVLTRVLPGLMKSKKECCPPESEVKKKRRPLRRKRKRSAQ